MLNKYVLFVLLVFASVMVHAQETPDIQEGLWEVKSETQIVGMPMQMPVTTTVVTHCYTRQNMKPQNIMQQSNCRMNKMELKSNKADWEMSCDQQGMTMHGTGNIQYQKTSFSGLFVMLMSGAKQGNMKIQTKLTGRYIGKCP